MAKKKEARLDDRRLKKFLKNIDKKIKAKKAISKAASPIVFRDVVKHFEQERGEKDKWPAWSTAYQKHMERIGKAGNKILQDTGRLRQSFLPSNARIGRDFLLWFNPAKVVGGFPYAAAHDIGGTQLPKRKFMWISKDALDDIATATLKVILGDT